MRKLRISAAIIGALTCVLGGVGDTQAAVHHRKTVKHAKKVSARVHGLVGPALLTPSNGAHVQQVPALTWSAVSGAVEYEYQLAADPRFDSIVLGSGIGKGTSTTHNLAAALEKPLTDGTYYWRVRGLTSTKEPGAWSATHTVEKTWSERPQLLGPAEGAAIAWPSVPLVMSWTTVSSATEYIVTIATDPGLSHTVLGSATSPTKTWGSVYALPGTLAAGQYYWEITPVDAEGHRGTPSAVRTFSWSWPTGTSTQLTDLSSPSGFEPQFSWAPVPGAARYEVEVNQSPEFPLGSKWCCNSPTIGTALSPTEVLANDHSFFWRVRAIDASGNAGVWNLGVGERGNAGEGFTEAFDSVAPTVPGLTMTDAHGTPEPPGTETDTPIVTWSPTPRASSYEVQITPYVQSEAGCEWFGGETVQTSTLAWTPLAPSHGTIPNWPSPESGGALTEGTTYCVRVRARSDHDAQNKIVVSDWTQLGGLNAPAFTFLKQPTPVGTPGTNPSINYLMPAPGSTSPRTPLFTWERVPGAAAYYVVIARDAAFTEVVDVASTSVPAYAPPLEGEEPLNDQTNAYYWAVVPFNAEGKEFALPPQRDHPQAFNKSSVPPTPFAPVGGAQVDNQPTFSWSPAEGALNYTLQVSADPSFGNPIDNVRTDSTSYTSSSSTYPADATLYWRVRANDTNPRAEGLNWSAVQAFRRTLPAPTPAASNPTRTEAISTFSFTPVPGATSYDLHVEQPDGTTDDFTLDSTAFTPTEWDGPGIWRWEARAEFPSGLFQQVPGGYFARQAVAHTLGPPAGAQGVKSGSRIVISWNPEPYAKEYEVQISTSDTFSSTIESHRIEQSSWAPDVNVALPANRGTLYWRVAALDNRRNLGPFASGSFVAPKPKAKCVLKKVKKKGRTVKVCAAPKPAKRQAKKHH